MRALVTDDQQRVAEFVARRIGVAPDWFRGYAAIGLEKDGELIAGVVYTDYTQTNIFMHVAAVPGSNWATRDFVWAVFHYPFEVAKVKRVTGWVEGSNEAARKLDENLGFKLEARLKEAARDGSDVLLYCMFKEDCRFLSRRYTPKYHRG